MRRRLPLHTLQHSYGGHCSGTVKMIGRGNAVSWIATSHTVRRGYASSTWTAEAANEAGGIRSPLAPPPTMSETVSEDVAPWLPLIEAVAALRSRSHEEDAANEAVASRTLAHERDTIAAIWTDTYHRCFGDAAAAPELERAALFPSSCEAVLCLVQALTDCAMAMRGSGGGGDSAHEAIAVESQALALLLLQTSLPASLQAARQTWVTQPMPVQENATAQYVSGLDVQPLPKPPKRVRTVARKLSATRSEQEEDDDDDDADSHRDEEDACKVGMVGRPLATAVVTTASALTTSHTAATANRDLSALGLHRAAVETVQGMAAQLSLSPSQQLQWIVLVDTLLHATRSLPLTHGAQYASYLAALTAMEVAEALPSAAVVSVAECLARCAPGYIITQQQQQQQQQQQRDGSHHDDNEDHRTHESNMRRHSVVETALQEMDPRPFCRHMTNDGLHRSPAEAEEALTEASLQGGLQSAIKPVSLIGHLDVLARVMRQRTSGTIAAYEAACAADANGEKTTTSSVDWTASASSCRAAAEREEAMNGFLSLAQRKAKQAAEKRSASKVRAAVDAHAVTSSTDKSSAPFSSLSSSTKSSGVDAEALENSDTSVATLVDVAQVATALASLRYMDAVFWSDMARFTTWSAQLAARLSAADGQTAETSVTSSLMRDVRDVCFALDYVQQATLYDQVMGTLVEEGYLAEAIPPPSHALRQMKRAKQISSNPAKR